MINTAPAKAQQVLQTLTTHNQKSEGEPSWSKSVKTGLCVKIFAETIFKYGDRKIKFWEIWEQEGGKEEEKEEEGELKEGEKAMILTLLLLQSVCKPKVLPQLKLAPHCRETDNQIQLSTSQSRCVWTARLQYVNHHTFLSIAITLLFHDSKGHQKECWYYHIGS